MSPEEKESKRKSYYQKTKDRQREVERLRMLNPEVALSVRARRKDAVIAQRKRQKERVYATLGRECVRCGFDDIRALQVDHIRGGGNEERRTLNTYQYIERIIRVGRSEYQMLCANCNAIKRVEEQE